VENSVKFVFLTEPEVEGVAIRWDMDAPKSPELVSAALAAGFSDREVRGSPLGFLEQEYNLGPGCVCQPGARALIGTNGSTLLELPE
jgi:hypothetical protein